MTRQEREELNSLSKRAFGSSSKWQKLVNSGTFEQFERTREVMVPTASGTPMKKSFTDYKYVTKRYSVDEVRKFMVDLLNQDKEKVLDSIVKNTSVDGEVK